ncbi:MAG: YraN family protein [Phycisphaerales bacterium]
MSGSAVLLRLATLARRIAEIGRGTGTTGGARTKASVGRAGEREAAKRMRKLGYRVLRRNARIARQEIDLVCLAPDDLTIVLVEVKTRHRAAGAPAASLAAAPERAVDERKRLAMRAAATALRTANGWERRPMRLDVVAIELHDRGRAEFRHWPGPRI